MAVISVSDVHKKFRVFYDKGQTFKERLLFRNRNHYEDRWVLKGINFDVEQGEAIGLVGENGCGKSTLLKLMTRIMYPDQGQIQITGRVSSLIELGAGFHPDMSGRENIYTNASIFGLTRKEIDARLEKIIAFSELEAFIDNPVRTYSSGMYTRLAFSVAINVDADILLIDEILAVGDANFQAKCFNKMKEIKANGTTIVIVSHSMGQIEQICDRVYWIESGIIREKGVPRLVIQQYLEWIMSRDTSMERENVLAKPQIEINGNEEQAASEQNELQEKKEEKVYKIEEINKMRSSGQQNFFGNQKVRIRDIKLFDGKTGNIKNNFSTEDSFCLKVQYERIDPTLKEAIFSIAIYRSDGIMCYSTNTYIDTGETIQLKNNGVLELTIEPLQLLQGDYSVDISFMEDYGPVYHCILNAFRFTVYNARTDIGVFRFQHTWR